VTGVSPSKGSVEGGTLLTVDGRFFDQTDQPARVFVGGLPCEIENVSDDRITCRTAKQDPASKKTVYPGLKIEAWNDTRSNQLSDVFSFNESRPGYWTEWTDILPKIFLFDFQYFSTRSRGFFVPPESGNYMLYIHCDDRCELYLSNSSLPEHKVLHSSDDMAEYMDGATTVNITRLSRATPPLQGTFDVEIFGGRAEGLSVGINEEDLKYALEGIEGMGQLSVQWQGTCRSPKWRVEWLSKPGDQPLIQVNDSSVFGGTNIVVSAEEKKKGGLLMRSIADTTQVCRLGSATAGTYPVTVSFPSLGHSRYAEGNVFNFTYQLIITSFSPSSGSIADLRPESQHYHCYW
ncbi:unnamed protein product, partial [Tetraodon nigroviridis]